MTSATLPAIRGIDNQSLVKDFQLVKSGIAQLVLADPSIQLAVSHLEEATTQADAINVLTNGSTLADIYETIHTLHNDDEGYVSSRLWFAEKGINSGKGLHLLTELGLIGSAGACSNIALYDDTETLYNGDTNLSYEDLVLHNGKSITSDNTRTLYINTLSPYIKNFYNVFKDAGLIVGHTTGNRMSEKKAIKDNPSLKKMLGRID